MNNFNRGMQKNQFSSYFDPVLGIGPATNNIVWVQGIEGAKAWQLNPNSMVILLDSETEGKMYIKVSDNIGMSSLRIFNYTEEVPTAPTQATNNEGLDLSNYVTKDELINLVKEVLDEQSISTVAKTSTGAGPSASVSATASQPKVIYTARYGSKI